MLLEAEALAAYPSERQIPAANVAAAVAASGRVLVVLDDDPTGTQSVADLPVLTRWEVEDFRWAFASRIGGARPSAVYVLTNTRSLDPAEAAERNRQVVAAALEAARESGTPLAFVSRSDSTLRGHFPLETDVIASTVSELNGGAGVDGVVMVPAFPDAGRVTIGGEHYMRTTAGPGSQPGLTPVSETEFARDATFGFSTSFLPAYVEEKSGGRFRADHVIVLDLGIIRAGAEAIADAIAPATDGTPIVADIVGESDIRALALGLEEAERRGKSLLYRVGPPFVRGRIGQEVRAPLTAEEIYGGQASGGGAGALREDLAAGGLIVVGSHVGLTTRQLDRLTEQHASAHTVEIDVDQLLDPSRAEAHLEATVAAVVRALADGDVIVHTSRRLVKTDDPAASLEIARTVSAAVVRVVNSVLTTTPPRFVIAKGGITSSDVAAHGLEIRRAIVRGPMLPGIVSLWEPVDGPARGIPYIVFAGNVGDDESLAAVTRTLSSTF
ncbi:four-carbon acid sugar kinase family protein [Sinomonas mesophila]|uniref:four-carbon acid sugar kinase family protein n=1 Tax=Sinomonas mesophila TaxID=1531955 RepID=UPI000985CF40|nr:four-carbon acid sugar kinase family protein [Sinomonas mesophila]